MLIPVNRVTKGSNHLPQLTLHPFLGFAAHTSPLASFADVIVSAKPVKPSISGFGTKQLMLNCLSQHACWEGSEV